jgi:hypothetical protein
VIDLDTAKFAGQGFLHLRNVLDEDALYTAEGTILRLYQQQARKCGCETLTLPDILESMEPSDKEALYQVQTLLPGSQIIRAIFDHALMRRVIPLLGLEQLEDALLEGPGLFINRPNTQRLLYKWHSEAHYYPKRRRFVNAWIPMFGDKTADNGSMSLRVGSHTRDFPFAEYQGYDKDSQGKPNHFMQYEIPENFLTSYREHVCEAKRGDVILFDRALVHRSNPNKSNQYSFALVARIWTPTDDLSISGTMRATPYGGDIGRPGLVVQP